MRGGASLNDTARARPSRTLLENSVINALVFVASTAVVLVLTPFMLKSVGRQAYGVWVLVMAFSASGYASLLDLGIQNSVVKYVAEHRARDDAHALNEVVSAALIAYLGLGVIAATCLIVFAQVGFLAVFHVPAEHAPAAKTLLIILGLQLLVEFPSLALDGLLMGLQRFDLSRLLDLGRTLSFAGAVGVALATGHGIVSVGVAKLGVTLVSVPITVMVCRSAHSAWRINRSPSRRTVRQMVSFSARLLLIRVDALVYNGIDKGIIGAMMSSTMLTTYDIANRLHNLARYTLGFTSSMLVPAASGFHAVDNRARVRAVVIQGTKYTAAACLPVALIGMVLAAPGVQFWVGAQYLDSVVPARLFLSYLLFWPLVLAGYNATIGLGVIRPLVIIQWTTTAINLALSIVLTRRIGVTGVIWGTVIGNGLAFVPFLILFRRTCGVTWRDWLFGVVMKVYPSALAAAAVVFALQRLWPARSLWMVAEYGILGGAGYLALLAVLGLDAAERSSLRRLIRRRHSSPPTVDA